MEEKLDINKESTTNQLAQLNNQLTQLQERTSNLRDLESEVHILNKILSNNQARGAFGELGLETIIKDILPKAYFNFQATLGNGNRVDCRINMPDGHGSICIDSKYPHSSFIKLIDAKNDNMDSVRKEFSKNVITHIRNVQEKYIIPGETSDFALMFVPSESVYIELNENCQEVIQQGFQRKVVITSPQTLFAVLNAVRAIIRNKEMGAHINEIKQEVGKIIINAGLLEDRTAKFRKHFHALDKDVSDIETSTRKINSSSKRIDSINIESSQNKLEKRTENLE